MSQVKALFQIDEDNLDLVEKNVEKEFDSMKSGDYFGDVFIHSETDKYKRFNYETENFTFSMKGIGTNDKTKMAYLVIRK